jgi:hypothetical protein
MPIAIASLASFLRKQLQSPNSLQLQTPSTHKPVSTANPFSTFSYLLAYLLHFLSLYDYIVALNIEADKSVLGETELRATLLNSEEAATHPPQRALSTGDLRKRIRLEVIERP